MVTRQTEVLVCNFGGPTQSSEVYPFLVRLFEDPFIIRRKMPLFFRSWLAKKIAGKRAPHSDREYAKIGYSPINRCTEIQARTLESLLREINPKTKVHVVNRYMPPFASEVVPKIDPKYSRVFIITMYPHLCHSTSVSSIRDVDLAFEKHHGHREFPSVRIFSWWHHPLYMSLSFEALKRAIEENLRAGDGLDLDVLFSAHGIPSIYDLRGDPYVIETKAHFEELRVRTESWIKDTPYRNSKHNIQFHLSFQSRVGPVEWVRPYTEEKIRELAQKKPGKRLLMVPISFTSDHIETLFEMDHTYQALAKEMGFISYNRVKPPGEDPKLAECMREVLVAHGFC